MAVKVLNNSNGGYWRQLEKGFYWLIYNQLLKWNLINLGRYMSLSGLVIWIVCNWFFPPESLISISFIHFMYSWKRSSKNQSSFLATLVSCFWTNPDQFMLVRVASPSRTGKRVQVRDLPSSSPMWLGVSQTSLKCNHNLLPSPWSHPPPTLTN